MRQAKYYGVAPAFMFRCSDYVLPGTVFDDRELAKQRAWNENCYGEYRGKGCQVKCCDESGKIIRNAQ